MTRWLACAGVYFLVGCNANREPPYVSVAGTVKLDGSPLSEGRVVFLPTDGAAPRSIPIQNGRFVGEARAGKNVVQVHAIQEVPNLDPTAPPSEKTVGINLVAERFGHSSRDVRDVSETDPNEFELTVTAK